MSPYKAFNSLGRFLTLANFITIAGLFLSGYAIFLVVYGYLETALLVFIFASLTDFLDGWLARFIEKTKPGYGISGWGKVLDPLRDKFLGLIVVPLALSAGLTWLAPAAIVFLETVPVFILYRLIKNKTGKHYVSPESRIITTLQFVFIALWIMQMAGWLDGLLVYGFLSALLGLSCGRLMLYWFDFRNC